MMVSHDRSIYGVCVCVCVYIWVNIYTHTAHLGGETICGMRDQRLLANKPVNLSGSCF